MLTLFVYFLVGFFYCCCCCCCFRSVFAVVITYIMFKFERLITSQHILIRKALSIISEQNNFKSNSLHRTFSLFLQDWKNVQIALGKLGKDSIKRKIQELKVNDIPLDVALGARDLIRDFTLDQVRMVSAGGATFYIWVCSQLKLF